MKVLMCGSELSVKGGMVSVIKNYLGYDKWDNVEITYIPTHTEKNKIFVALYFLIAYIKVICTAFFGKYDILYLHTAERGSFYRKAILLRTARKFGIKTVMHHHAAEFEKFYESLSVRKKQYVNETLKLADLNIVLSERLVPMIKNKEPMANVKVLYNAVHTYKTNPYNKNATNILFLGRLGKRKGVYDLIKVIKEINNCIDPQIKFYLCGDGEIEKVKDTVRQQNIENRIAYVGWIDAEQKKEILKNTMINVLPSYNEGLPMTILETMSYGIPNISTDIASIPEVINSGKNGFLIKPGDTRQLSEYIKQLCKNSKLRSSMSDQCWLEVTEKFGLDVHINILTEYLTELI